MLPPGWWVSLTSGVLNSSGVHRLKTFVMRTGESGIMIDQHFGNCIPEKLTMLLVDMKSMSGDPTLNPLYFRHCNLANTHLTINGTTIYNITTDFDDDDYGHMFYESRKSIGIESRQYDNT